MQPHLNRRQWVAGSLGSLAMTGCARQTLQQPPSQVCITRAPEYSQQVYETVRRMFAELRIDARGKNVVLKPNLVEFEPGTVINTSPLVVHAVYEACRAMGAASVAIAEGPGHRRNTLDLADAAGYFGVMPRFEDAFTDLNLDEVSRVKLHSPHSRLESLYLPRTALRADLLVSVAKMKTHHWTGATLSMKNLFGLVPGGVYGWPKNVLHWAGISQCIADLHAAFPRHVAVVDGIVGMEGNGPIQGRPKPAGVLVAGTDMVAVDATCCRLMRIEPLRIDYLKLAAARGNIFENRIVQVGEPIPALATPFDLLPEFCGIRMENS